MAHISNTISHYFEKFASCEFPKPIQSFINNGYVKILGLDMGEFRDPSSYKTLNALFTRELVSPKNREFDQSYDNFICVADSFITAQGKLQKDSVLQIKGMQYNIDELLGVHVSNENKQKIHDGDFMNFYLSPKDYHRYHSPYSFQLKKLIHIPGKLYPVNFKYLNKQKDLFIENERVIAECVTNTGKIFYMVYVGALNVGKMVFLHEEAIETNIDESQVKVYEYDNLHIKKGECMGYFRMGSTVLCFFEKDMIELTNLENQKVRFSQIIGTLK
jgi:phosphatidylserine decarboxylase